MKITKKRLIEIIKEELMNEGKRILLDIFTDSKYIDNLTKIIKNNNGIIKENNSLIRTCVRSVFITT